MITANFYHIKSTNGLFFYGLDYVRENLGLVRVALVRPSLAEQLSLALPGVDVVSCSFLRYLREIFLSWWRGDLVYTPTSHPLPFIHHQWIVVHDDYPFSLGFRGKLKRLFLSWSLITSKCKVAYINESEARPFAGGLGLNPNRLIFAPNKFPSVIPNSRSSNHSSTTTAVGLLGTDSSKKNYAQLLTSVEKADLSQKLHFFIYGHDTAYYRAIFNQFHNCKIVLVKSDDNNLDQFFGKVDVLASVSDREGFGRPLAAALLSGMRVELIDRPVFREFFEGGACFHTDIDHLVRALPKGNKRLQTAHFLPPSQVLLAYAAACNEIRRMNDDRLK